jgi:aryl-alcohol dehydrogenase-like predicted oxidoreductase
MLTSPDLLKILLNVCEDQNISLLCAQPFDSGMLTSKILDKNYLDTHKKSMCHSSMSELIFEGKVKISKDLQEQANLRNVNLQHIALRYLLDLDITTILTDVETSAEITDNLKALKIPPHTHKQLQDIQLILDFENYFDSPKREN